jgi:hypothetical protein
MKPVTLRKTHYAAEWKMEGVVKSLPELDDLGRRYAELPAEREGISNRAKQDLLLELCQSFHPYLMKYLVMICRGHVPLIGIGRERSQISKDVVPFLLYFLPKGKKLDRVSASIVVRHFHLAFKGLETEEVYDILMEQLVRAINQYDPFYTEKVKRVVEIIHHGLSKRAQFSAADVSVYLDADCNRYLRMLCRRGFHTPRGKTGREEERAFLRTRSAVWIGRQAVMEDLHQARKCKRDVLNTEEGSRFAGGRSK